ncbi:MAG TPA: hypothetical protein VFK39_01580 [Gemmatimonadaceae bacterium]|nr:hypothetical protein [Gemmatimonadaceae bacterium]
MLASSLACGGERARNAGGAAADTAVQSLPAGTVSHGETVPPGEGASATEDERSDPTLGVPGALAVLDSYFVAINAHQFHDAYHLWSDDGAASGLTLEEFARGYDRTRSTMYRAGRPGRIEGAAGSRYIDIPVTIEAVTTDGVRRHFAGHIVLRRVVVTGASSEERLWHIYHSSVREVR